MTYWLCIESYDTQDIAQFMIPRVLFATEQEAIDWQDENAELNVGKSAVFFYVQTDVGKLIYET